MMSRLTCFSWTVSQIASPGCTGEQVESTSGYLVADCKNWMYLDMHWLGKCTVFAQHLSAFFVDLFLHFISHYGWNKGTHRGCLNMFHSMKDIQQVLARVADQMQCSPKSSISVGRSIHCNQILHHEIRNQRSTDWRRSWRRSRGSNQGTSRNSRKFQCQGENYTCQRWGSVVSGTTSMPACFDLIFLQLDADLSLAQSREMPKLPSLQRFIGFNTRQFSRVTVTPKRMHTVQELKPICRFQRMNSALSEFHLHRKTMNLNNYLRLQLLSNSWSTKSHQMSSQVIFNNVDHKIEPISQSTLFRRNWLPGLDFIVVWGRRLYRLPIHRFCIDFLRNLLRIRSTIENGSVSCLISIIIEYLQIHRYSAN